MQLATHLSHLLLYHGTPIQYPIKAVDSEKGTDDSLPIASVHARKKFFLDIDTSTSRRGSFVDINSVRLIIANAWTTTGLREFAANQNQISFKPRKLSREQGA
jgi:hypothetical protein